MASDINEYLASLSASPKFGPQVVFHKKIQEVPAIFSKSEPGLNSNVLQLIKDKGVGQLFSHQGEAIGHILAGKDVLVATPTASGKSMIYNLPVLNELFLENNSHSLYLFPLKALAQDQRNVLEGLYDELPGKEKHFPANISSLFDGDTSSYQRRKIRENPPKALLTNPEMLHLSLLPYHQNWNQFFSGLKYVIIDEVHSYRGVFGSHMSWVLRRLQRIAAHYSSCPTFILLSATIGNPGELGRRLLGRKVQVITASGAPQAKKNMVFLNPWDSAAYTASQLLEAAVKRGLRVIVYTQSRKMTELINIWTAPRLGELSSKLSAYRAGFLPEERREIESQLFSGSLLGVISTSALELGIDIGDLDLCILVGYPGSIMATWQRGGRVGRSMRQSAIILIGQEDALDQHFMRQPEDFFARSPEAAVLNPLNSTIVDQHLICCAAELPLSAEDKYVQGSVVRKRIAKLSLKGALLQTASGNSWVSPRKYPQRNITLRGGGRQMSIIDEEKGEVVGEIDADRGMKECHPGAVYLHRSRTWLVTEFNLTGNEVIVRLEKPKYFTRPTSEKQTEVLELLDSKMSFGVQVSYGRLRVRERVTGYQKRNSHTHKLISTTPLELPEQVIETVGVWVDIPAEIVTRIEKEKLHFMGAIHAMEHAMIALFPLLVLCDRNDIGGISCPFHEQTESASVFIYDGYPGGVGLAKEAYGKMDTLLSQTKSTIEACSCDTGCPSCVHSPKCGSGNRPIDKKACVFLLREIISSKIISKSRNRLNIQDKLSPALYNKKPTATPGESTGPPLKFKGVDALPARYGVFDLETIRSADEVGGWHHSDRMGMSVGVVYDSQLDDYVSYLEHEAPKLVAHLETLELVVGFNNKRFDNRVLSAYTSKNLNRMPTLDLLEEVHNYLGYRLSLNGLAEQTLGAKKSADGLQALTWYKEGRIDLIQKYCKKDVEITKNLLLHGLEQGFLLFANKAKQIVRLPLALDSSISQILERKESVRY
ncbi:MAG: DEAD/DEAH box helicase [Desulfobulbaceae bacterium]|nr:DEAD/DEAH box helicase [Desulfobulbaceae bacterium]